MKFRSRNFVSFILLLLSASLPSFAQKISIGDSLQTELQDIQPLDSNFLVLGVKTDDPPTMGKIMSGQTAFELTNFISLIDHNGKEIRHIQLDSLPYNTILRCILVLDDIIVVAGATRGYDKSTCMVALTKNLEVKWISTTLPGETHKLAALDGKNVVACGNSGPKAQLFSFNYETGKMNWFRSFAAADTWDWYEAFDVLVNNQQLWIAGSVPTKSQENFGVFSTDLQGNKLLEKTFGEKRGDATLIRNYGDDILVAGAYDSYKDIGFLARMNQNGDTIFTKQFGCLEMDVNKLDYASDSLIQAKWGKEQGIVPKDLIVLPNQQLLMLCAVYYYEGPPRRYADMIRTIGLLHFSQTGELLVQSVLQTEFRTVANRFVMIAEDEFMIVGHEELMIENQTVKRGFLYTVKLDQLFYQDLNK